MTLRDSEQRREVAASPWRRCNYTMLCCGSGRGPQFPQNGTRRRGDDHAALVQVGGRAGLTPEGELGRVPLRVA
jgi:hypothetical protein